MAAITEHGGMPAPCEARDLTRMTDEEVLDYINGGGSLAALVRDATPSNAGTEPAGELPVRGESVRMTSKTFRLPVDMFAALEDLAGNDKGGVSALVREAIRDFLDHVEAGNKRASL